MKHAERKRFWLQYITDWWAPGLSGMVYCQQQSLIVYWHKKLAQPVAVPEQPVQSGFAKVAATLRSGSSEGLTVSMTLLGANSPQYPC